MGRARLRLCAAALLVLSSACLVVAAPPLPAGRKMHSVLDHLADAVAHPAHAPALHTAQAGPHAGSLHSATVTRRVVGEHAAAAMAAHDINPKNQAKAAAFVAHLDHLVAGLKAKSHLARLSNKYPASRSRSENATLAAAEAEAAHEADTAEWVDHAMEEDEFGGMHDAPLHAPAGSAEAHMHASIAQVSRQRASSAHIPHREPPALIQSPHVAVPDHPVLSPVAPRRRGPARQKPRAPFRSEETGYVLHPIQLPPTEPSPSGLNFTTFVYPTAEGNVTIFVGVTEYPLGKFHFFPSPRDEMDEISLMDARRMHRGQQEKARQSPMREHLFSTFLEMRATLNPLCDGVATTSASAQAYNCLLAQNAGFFNMQTDGCMGNVVSNDQFINHATADLQGHSHFGLTRKGNYITGYLTEEEVAAGVDGGFHELIQGSGWLIREGQNFINESAVREKIGQGFVTEKAPRNAIGHDKEGRLLMFEADGEEDIKLGLTLIEFADILMHHFDVENAINVDGGGSSTTVYQGEVVDKPTCRDTPQICERAVTTISCVMP